MKTRSVSLGILAVLLGMMTPFLPAQAEPVPVRLKVLSYNVWGLPAPLGRDLAPRMERIAESIKDYDIVMLQETFDKTTENLAKASGFPYVYHHQNGDLWHQACGLMTLSRYEIVATDFLDFPRSEMPDALAYKGVMFTRIKHPQLGFVDVYNTHYQSRPHEDAALVRIESDNKALEQLVFKHNRYYPTIFGGDFNLVPGKSEYADLMRRLPLIDVYAEARPQAAAGQVISHHTWPAWQAQSEVENRIDYVFLLKSGFWNFKVSEARIVFGQPVRDYLLSDHLGVASTIEITPVPGPVTDVMQAPSYGVSGH